MEDSMKLRKSIAARSYVLVFFAVSMVVVLSAFRIGALSAGASKRQVDFPVISRVPKLTVVNLKVHGEAVLFSVRNDYDKTITAFSVTSSGVTTRNEMLGSDYVIAPRSTNTGEYELPSPSRPENGIAVMAAVFEDGTTDGDPEFVRQILDARAGKQAQLARILPILEEASITLKDAGSNEKWQTIQLRIAQLPDCEKRRSFEFCAALNDEKELALREVKQVEQIKKERGDEVAQAIISHIKERYERSNIMLQLSLKQVQ
jgi:hypothetical protein